MRTRIEMDGPGQLQCPKLKQCVEGKVRTMCFSADIFHSDGFEDVFTDRYEFVSWKDGDGVWRWETCQPVHTGFVEGYEFAVEKGCHHCRNVEPTPDSKSVSVYGSLSNCETIQEALYAWMGGLSVELIDS